MSISIRFSLLCAAALLPAGTAVHAGPVPLVPPAESTIPKGPEGDAIKLGKLLISDTRKQLPNNVGNGLCPRSR